MTTTSTRRRTAQTGGSLRIGLFDPGMTVLHRVGLAGLWLTLHAIEREHPGLKQELNGLGGAWMLSSHAVELSWSGDGKGFFDRLIKESFRLTADGRFWFLGLGHPDSHQDLGTTLQAAVLDTFLQHGKTRSADPPTGPGGSLVLDVDDQARTFRYRRVSAYAHQQAAREFRLDRPNVIAGWLLPGGVVRHVAFSNATALVEAPGAWLSLLYAPVGAIYFRVRRRTRGIRPQFCLVLPELDNLEAYERARRLFLSTPVRNLVVAGAADAGLRVLAELEAADLLSTMTVARCHVIAFGIAPWSKQQRTRMDRFVVESTDPGQLHLYRVAVQLLPPLLRPPRASSWPDATGGAEGRRGRGGRRSRSDVALKTADTEDAEETEEVESGTLWEISPLLDLMARNLAGGQPWWRNITGVIRTPDTWKQWRSYEITLAQRQPRATQTSPRGVAAVVVQPNAFEEPAHAAIVRACQEAWRRRLGALSARARERGERFQDLAERERERLRIAFAHCKNADSLRAALVDFWSRAGPIPTLQERWRELLPYLGPERWQLTRDLALLALVSYAAPEEQSTSTPPDSDGDTSSTAAS
jgi:CRISPR-associated protein Cas8a1/Csx13